MTTTLDGRVITPTVFATIRRWLFWVGAAVLAVLIVLGGILVQGAATEQEFFSATNPGPSGTQALVEVLRDRGVDVVVTDSLAGTLAAFEGEDDATLLFFERDVFLDDTKREAALELGSSVVLVTPGFSSVDALAPGVTLAGATDADTLDAGCALPVAERAETISAEGDGYRLLDDAEGVTECFTDGDVSSLLQLDNDDRTISVLGAAAALTNEHIGEVGNAALALGLLGENDTLIWYIPGPGDVDSSTATLGQLSPPWVLPAIGVVGLAVLAAAFWRGRRFGPLIVENLPVTVRASETMMGRARLYASISARLRALDSLRIGSVTRIGALCGLPRAATVEEIVGAAAVASRRPIAEVRHLLLEAEPANDRELIALSDDLLDLERSIAENIRPS
ncbi:DUF4350 domain-containing protein [Glaciihabitans arcticus]|uniref:DUF4350 domain-containing protein n=1 Tax=Glaciihabitans arcticus TaxID=2668039 RepID=A0A4Q9GMS3_9MICO|nr:DUF4350 domain-containing protein [Glaciihabitans arcticus]TBN55996.1 DUF4350 domain-containing protein [Glaciihabitans arcticus]